MFKGQSSYALDKGFRCNVKGWVIPKYHNASQCGEMETII